MEDPRIELQFQPIQWFNCMDTEKYISINLRWVRRVVFNPLSTASIQFGMNTGKEAWIEIREIENQIKLAQALGHKEAVKLLEERKIEEQKATD
jgi:hypothetical protein